LLDELLILTPVLLPVFLSWAAFYEVDRAVRIARQAATEDVVPIWSRTGYLLFQARHQLGVLMVPLLCFLAIHDSVQLARPDLLDKPLGAVIFGLPVVALFLLFPVLLRTVWKTEPLGEGPLRARLSAVARQCGFCPTDILIWQTEGMVANAAVTGIWHRLRYVFLSDRLLAHFSDDELVAVFGHELGHVRHRHLWTRGLAILAPLAAWWSIEFWLPGVAASVAALPDVLDIDGPLARSLVAMAALVGALVFVLGFYSQRLEHEADLFAIDVCGPVHSRADTSSLSAHPFVTALEKLAVLNGMSRASNSWQHASIARRVEFLERAAADPDFTRRFHGRIKLVGRLLITIVLFGFLSQALAFLAAVGTS
jgi:STE24 endopeptidase